MLKDKRESIHSKRTVLSSKLSDGYNLLKSQPAPLTSPRLKTVPVYK